MATADVISSEDDGFEVQISKVKKEIGICFLQLMDCLKEREREKAVKRIGRDSKHLQKRKR